MSTLAELKARGIEFLPQRVQSPKSAATAADRNILGQFEKKCIQQGIYSKKYWLPYLKNQKEAQRNGYKGNPGVNEKIAQTPRKTDRNGANTLL